MRSMPIDVIEPLHNRRHRHRSSTMEFDGRRRLPIDLEQSIEREDHQQFSG